MAKLIVISGDERQEFELAAFNTIGRHPDNTIQILDRIISKEHAQVQRLQDGRFILRDLRSLNGTFIRGERIAEHYFNDGDEVTMGSTRLLFVDKPQSEEPLHRVTIAPGFTDSHIRQRIQASTGDFMPEKQLADDKVLRRDYERLRIGHELARAVGSELDLEKLLPKILDKAFELVGADRGAILLIDDKNEMVPRYVKTRSARSDANIVLSRTVMQEVTNNKAAVLSSDATMDSRFSGAHSIIMQGIRSTMTLPLLHGNELLGIMHLDSLFTSNAFTEKDLQICTGMASQAAIAIQNANLARRIEKEAQTRAQISRLIPPSVVEQVVKGELLIEKGGRVNEITMLFSDIRGFTTMSDGQPPEDVVNTLNEYFEVMVDILFQYTGTLDKFVGDEIIGLFGAPIALDDAPFKAVSCAISMLQALGEFNRTRAAENQPAINIGIGINTGKVITGAIGSTRALQYTAIGGPMNVASRLVNLASAGEIILAESTYLQVQDRIDATALPPVKVKGVAAELKIYRVNGLRTRPGAEAAEPDGLVRTDERVKWGVALCLLLGLATSAGTARAEPTDCQLVYVGLGMALPDYMLGVTLHEGSHAVVARLMGAHVTQLHLWPGRNPQTHHFQFGWTTTTGLPRTRGRQILFLVAPKITDTLMLTGFGLLYATDSLPSNRWGWLTLQVLATGFWVDFAKDVVVFHRFNDVVRIFNWLGWNNEWKRLPARLLYAALDVGAGALVYLGWRDLFRANDGTAARIAPIWGTTF